MYSKIVFDCQYCCVTSLVRMNESNEQFRQSRGQQQVTRSRTITLAALTKHNALSLPPSTFHRNVDPITHFTSSRSYVAAAGVGSAAPCLQSYHVTAVWRSVTRDAVTCDGDPRHVTLKQRLWCDTRIFIATASAWPQHRDTRHVTRASSQQREHALPQVAEPRVSPLHHVVPVPDGLRHAHPHPLQPRPLQQAEVSTSE